MYDAIITAVRALLEPLSLLYAALERTPSRQQVWSAKPKPKRETVIFEFFVAVKRKGIPMKIEVKKPREQELNERGIRSWPTWEKEVSRFDWTYDDTEECYLLEGKVIVETNDGETVEFGKGDFVTFPKGLSCIWDIKEPVKKHYNFK